MKTNVVQATDEEKRSFVIALTKQVIIDSRKHNIFESDDDEIDMFIEFNKEVISVNKITFEMNGIKRTLFSGLIVAEQTTNIGDSIMPYYELFEFADNVYTYLHKDDLALCF